MNAFVEHASRPDRLLEARRVLGEAEIERLTIFKLRYVAERAYGLGRSDAERLVFARWLRERGR